MNLIYLFIAWILTAFGQPAWIRGFGVLAAAFGFAFFWKGMLSFSRSRDRFVLSLIWFSSVQAIQLSWMATLDYMGPLILLLYFFLIIGMGIQFGLISLLVNQSISWPRALAAAGCWVVFEWTRLFILCGFTWNPSGLALTDSPYSLQFAAVWGIFGLSFWVIFVNLIGLKAWLEHSRVQTIFWASLAIFPYLFGFVHQNWIESNIPFKKNLSVALVHTNLSPEQKEFSSTEPDSYILPLEQWDRIINSIPEKKIDLIVLPEAALPLGAHHATYHLAAVEKYFNKENFPPFKRPYASFDRGTWKVSNAFLLQTLANQYNAHVISGLDDHDFRGRYNAAFHFQPQNRSYERYEKQILVPVGEYVPFKNWKKLSQFIGDQFGIYSSFDPGKEGKVFSAQVPIGISICVEETFSELIRQLRIKGAELFVNITNDAWFPNSKLACQHFYHGRVRAVENGVPILRACNAGISGGIDCFGRPLETLQELGGKTKSLFFSFPIRSYTTLYTWWGDSAILGMSLSFMISYFLFRKKKLP